MYKNNSIKSQFQLRVDDTYHYNVRVKVGVHQGLALGLLLFVIMLEAMSHKFRRGCPWELSYTDDLDIIASSEEDRREKSWKCGKVVCRSKSLEKTKVRHKSWPVDLILTPGLQIIFQNLSNIMSGKNKIPSDIYENLSDINFYKCF